jgi:hypothetical protein
MNARFDPAPFDKYAATSAEAAKLDRQTSHDLKAGLVGTFPASDPVSPVQPAPTKEPASGFWRRLISLVLP